MGAPEHKQGWCLMKIQVDVRPKLPITQNIVAKEFSMKTRICMNSNKICKNSETKVKTPYKAPRSSLFIVQVSNIYEFLKG